MELFLLSCRNIDTFLLPVEVSVNSSTPTLSTSHASQLCIIFKLAESTLCASIQDTNEKLTQLWPHYQLLTKPRVTILQWDPVLLTTILQAWKFNLFSVHVTVHLLNYFMSPQMRISREMVFKVKIKINKTTELPSSTESAISF